MIYDLVRYQLVDENTSSMKRENVLLVSLGCSWGKCTFCDYQDDKSSSVLACDSVNKKVLAQVKVLKLVQPSSKLHVLHLTQNFLLPRSTI